MTVTSSEVLEVLYGARARLENRRLKFEFSNWTSCTCGHIYAASLGKKAKTGHVVVEPLCGNRYSEIIQSVASALGWKGGLRGDVRFHGRSAALYVSDYTSSQHGHERQHALVVINKAIATIEFQQEADRLAVLAQLKEVVNEEKPEVVAV